MITPAQARALANKPWFERQIEREATKGLHGTAMEGSFDALNTAKIELTKAGFACGDIRNPFQAQAFVMSVTWAE